MRINIIFDFFFSREGSFIIEFESLFITTLKIMIADGESLDRTTQRPTDGRGDDPDFNLHVDVDRFQKLIKEISQIDDAIVSGKVCSFIWCDLTHPLQKKRKKEENTKKENIEKKKIE
jgi:hypothetical protein